MSQPYTPRPYTPRHRAVVYYPAHRAQPTPWIDMPQQECRGRHCAGRVRVHPHRDARIPDHV